MSTPLTDRIEALTAQANAVTGASDTTLTDAVGTLIAGYGSGGIDVTITSEISFSPDLADFLYNAIGGEVGATYAAKLKYAVVPDLAQHAVSLVFTRLSAEESCIGGMVRWNSATRQGGYNISSTYNARTTAGDIYTVYTL